MIELATAGEDGMADNSDDKSKKTGLLLHELDETEDESGQGTSTSGGQSGQIEFRDFLASTDSLREDLLSGSEKKRFLSSHELVHEGRVKKQKILGEQRQAVKDGKIPVQNYRQGLGNSGHSQYKANPALKDKAQFSGIDRQENPLPNDNTSDNNPENRLRNQPQLQMQPKFNPPRLTK